MGDRVRIIIDAPSLSSRGFWNRMWMSGTWRAGRFLQRGCDGGGRADHQDKNQVRRCLAGGELPVKFIATATIGMDHIDLPYCNERGIIVRNSAGCNAGGVMNYVFSALYGVAARKAIRLEGGRRSKSWGSAMSAEGSIPWPVRWASRF